MGHCHKHCLWKRLVLYTAKQITHWKLSLASVYILQTKNSRGPILPAREGHCKALAGKDYERKVERVWCLRMAHWAWRGKLIKPCVQTLNQRAVTSQLLAWESWIACATLTSTPTGREITPFVKLSAAATPRVRKAQQTVAILNISLCYPAFSTLWLFDLSPWAPGRCRSGGYFLPALPA